MKASPVLPDLVGITQSNMSTPLFTAPNMSAGVPTPIKYLGLSTGITSLISSNTLNISFCVSPTAKPPMAYPSKPILVNSLSDLILKSLNKPPWTIPNKALWGFEPKAILDLSAQ